MNNDLISRSALVDEFRARKMTDAVPNYDRATVDVKDALYQYTQLTKGLLFAAPAVDAEVVRHEGNTTFITTDNLDAYADRVIIRQGNWYKVYYRDSDDAEVEG